MDDGQGYVIIAHPDQTELIALARQQGCQVITQNELPDGIQGNEASIALLDDHLTEERATKLKDALFVLAYSAKTKMLEDMIIHYVDWTVPDCYVPTNKVHHHSTPKKIPFKQAQVRQSFRQSMRSVNRNR